MRELTRDEVPYDEWVKALDALLAAQAERDAAVNALKNRAAEKMPNSFVEMEWACGHKGGAACQRCFDAACAKRDEAQATKDMHKERQEKEIARADAAYARGLREGVRLALIAAAEKGRDCAGLLHSTPSYIYDSIRALRPEDIVASAKGGQRANNE